MALETLKDVKQLGGFDVVVMDDLRILHPDKFNESGSMDYKWFEAEIRPKNFVYVRHDVNSISFTLQNGPVKKNGVNGCQVETLVYAAVRIIKGLNHLFPCAENEKAIQCFSDGLGWLTKRTEDRKRREVEGKNEK